MCTLKKIFGHIPYNRHINILLFKMCHVELKFLQKKISNIHIQECSGKRTEKIKFMVKGSIFY